ncbi:MAG: hypothetical protein NTX73_04910 [Rhodobacterales bacterium]|nr:hypothetical protein [Rhodobacterales bacterium]
MANDESVPMKESPEFRAFQAEVEGRNQDYQAIGRVGALFLILRSRDSRWKKIDTVMVDKKQLRPLYELHEAGLFGKSRAVLGFSRGHMTSIEKQLRTACERIVGPLTDKTIDEIAVGIDQLPIGAHDLANSIKNL